MKLHRLHISDACQRAYRHCFPERQVFLRSGGEVRFLRLSPRIQVLTSCGVTVAMVWMGIIAYTAFHRDEAVISKERELSYVSDEFDKLLAEMDRIQSDAIVRARMLEERQALLETAAGMNSVNVTDVGEKSATEADDNTGEGESGLTGSLQEESFARMSFNGHAPSLFASLIGSRKAQADPAPLSSRLTVEIDAVLERLDRLSQRQNDAARRISAAHRQEIEAGRNILAGLKLPVDSMLDETGLSAVGGPYIPEADPAGLTGPFAKLAINMDRMQRLQILFSSLPSVSPAEKYYLSSRFGNRHDPFTKVRAHHSGLDLAGWSGEPIRAAAPGKVVKAGRYPAYGNMVEIEHGNGLRTRYGHMRRIAVKSGQIVDDGDQIGEMGSTGRSTGTHLHWEVWVNGKVVDPLPYLKAIKDVQDYKRRFAQAR